MRRYQALELVSRIQGTISRIRPNYESRIRRLASESSQRRFVSTHSHDDEPFYGTPRPAATNFQDSSHPSEASPGQFVSNSISDRIALAVYHATTAFTDPTRADAVAALAEVTGTVTLRKIHEQMMADPTGRLILKERPVVSKASIPYDKLIAEAPDNIHDCNEKDLTFGQVYGAFLKGHGFDPDERDQVNHIEDETLAYIMLRYRQNHDFFHALTGLPPTVLGELGLKWLELFQTGLPIAALSCTVGSLRLSAEEREILQNSYLPWAVKHMNSPSADTPGSNIDSSCFLMNVYYEKEFDTPIVELRKRLNLVAAPTI